MPDEEIYLTGAHFKYNAELTGPTQIYRDKKLSIAEINKLDNLYNPKDNLKILF